MNPLLYMGNIIDQDLLQLLSLKPKKSVVLAITTPACIKCCHFEKKWNFHEDKHGQKSPCMYKKYNKSSYRYMQLEGCPVIFLKGKDKQSLVLP